MSALTRCDRDRSKAKGEPGRRAGLSVLLLCLLFAAASSAAAADAIPPVAVLKIDGSIGPATADFVSRGLISTQRTGAQLLVIQMDTPGGLDSSLRDIVKAMLASSVPVAVYVAPSGARAASAGTYILYASHIAAMAPGTNVGAATPVAIGGGGEPQEPSSTPDHEKGSGNQAKGNEAAMRAKQVNDASAYIRGLAQMRGRNAEWAERAVREAVSLTAAEALKQRVIDLIAMDMNHLLQQIHGRKLTAGGVEHTLSTAGAPIYTIEPDWRTRLLAVITEPSVAYILLLIGIYGLLFEFYNPGFLLPGVAGAISLVTALFALHLLPVNYAGLGLLLLGIAFLIAEGFVPSFGALGIGGAIAFVLGSVMLIGTDVPGYRIPWPLIGGVTAMSLLFAFAVVGMAVKARRRPVVTGREELIGTVGELLEDAEPDGFAFLRSEHWRVHVCGAERLPRGQKVRVVGVRGLLLDVVSEEEGGID